MIKMLQEHFNTKNICVEEVFVVRKTFPKLS